MMAVENVAVRGVGVRARGVIADQAVPPRSLPGAVVDEAPPEAPAALPETGERTWNCTACGGHRTMRPRSRAWWLVIVAAWAALLLVGASGALVIGLNFFVVPGVLAAAGSLGALSRRVHGGTCTACGACPEMG